MCLKSFRLEKKSGVMYNTLQGDLIYLYLFILVLEVVLAVIKSNQNIDKLRIFEHDFRYTAYADDTTLLKTKYL